MEKPKKQICMVAPFDLVQWLEKQATAQRRSVSGQIVYLLTKAKDAEEPEEPAKA